MAMIVIGLAACCAACSSAVAAIHPSQDANAPPGGVEVLREITRIANEVANARSYFADDLRPILVEASYSQEDGVLYFDFDERLGREAGYTGVTDLTTYIEEDLKDVLKKLSGFNRISYRFGGHDTGWWLGHPGGLGATSSKRERRTVKSGVPNEEKPVVVAGGHGLYYHYGQKRWTTHREPANDILEDDIAQGFADKLHARLQAKRIPSENMRSYRGGLAHEPSGKKWWNVGARYHLEATHPELTDVWNSQPADDALDRERKQDIRSRPLYANHLNAAAVLHIHTNAAAPSARGTRVYVYPGRMEDAKLASLVLCGMAELIHSVDAYAGYKVPSAPSFFDKHAETKLAIVPAVIVEVGFHTNQDDAKYLADPYFQNVAMRGAAKGYMLYRDDKACSPFAIDSDQAADVVVWGRGKLPIALSGNPDFPIKVLQQEVDCETCKPEQLSIWDGPSIAGFRIEHGCRPEDLDRSPIRYVVTAVDASGVKTNAATYTFNCVPRGRIATSG
jgi:hypothetical protein